MHGLKAGLSHKWQVITRLRQMVTIGHVFLPFSKRLPCCPQSLQQRTTIDIEVR
ncbi:hypothetical protein JCM19039_3358 [Geomicrobium sp. JCM 19039]|nr:hypothetical protein JCM19039_3358 [Geomicrobium sp. JCM 19039]